MRYREPKDVGRDFASWLVREGLTEGQAAELFSREINDFSISQPWLNRLKNGDFRRFSTKLRLVLAYARIRIDAECVNDPGAQEVIDAAVRDVWDGTLSSAHGIAQLLRAAHRLQGR